MGCQGSGSFCCDCGASRSRATTEDAQGRAARRGRGHAGRIWRGEENAGDPSATSLAQVRAYGSIKFVGARNRSGRCIQGARCHPTSANRPARDSQTSGSAASHTGGHREGGRRRSMSRGGIVFLIVVAAVGGAAAGYWYGRSTTVTRDSPPLAEATAAEAERTILYYRDPSGAPYWSATPKKDDQGRDYLPVYDDEPSSAASKPATRSSSAGSKRIRYYRNPMGLPDTSSVPKKDSMGMDYIPVYADEAGAAGTVKIAPERIQTLGVRTEVASRRSLARAVRAVGTVMADERRIGVVNPKFEGWIERLLVSTT